MPQSYTNLVYHIVFSTRDRRPYLGAEIRPRLFEYLVGAVRAEGGIAYLINGVADHIHILARLRQDKDLAGLVRDIKANSSGWIHRTFAGLADFAWQNGYGAFTVSQSQVERVKHYIANQEDHHRKLTFREEFVAMLRANGIEFDEQYVLG